MAIPAKSSKPGIKSGRPNPNKLSTDLHGQPQVVAQCNYDYAGQDPINRFDLNGACWTGLCWAQHAYDASKDYLSKHRWARCVVFAASVALTGGSYGLAVKEAIAASREGKNLAEIIAAVSKGASTKVGTAGGLGVLLTQLTGGCIG